MPDFIVPVILWGITILTFALIRAIITEGNDK